MRKLAAAALFLLPLLSCGAAEAPGVALTPHGATCDPGSLASLQACPAPAGCHLCAVLPSGAACAHPCVVGGNECPNGLTCHPIDELRRAGGYGRVGDCPDGYCR